MSQVDKKSSRCSLDKMTSAPKQKSIMGLKAECGKETKEINPPPPVNEETLQVWRAPLANWVMGLIICVI